MISIIVVTRDRPQKIINCVNSILHNSFKNFELILIDQSGDYKTKDKVKKLKDARIRYIETSLRGKAKGLNKAIERANSKILAFTDDDCIVDKDWLKNINRSFNNNKNIAGVFGQVFPWRQKKHKTELCPSTFRFKKKRVINSCKTITYSRFGLGSNMAWKKSVFNKIGEFKNWLGPGSLVVGGEESEFIYRALKNNYRLLLNPRVKVWHNRWFTYPFFHFFEGKYTCAFTVFCSYGFFQGQRDVLRFMKSRLKERIVKKLCCFWNILKKRDVGNIWRYKKEFIFIIWEMFCCVRGFLIGFYFALKESKKR